MRGQIVRKGFKRENREKGQTLQRAVSSDRFSSFQTPPPSEDELEEFSDFDSTLNCEDSRPQKLITQGRHRSYILVEEMPLQYSDFRSSTNKKQLEKQFQKQDQNAKAKIQNNSSNSCKYNYMSRKENQLSTIKQDSREYLKTSSFSSKHPSYLKTNQSLLVPPAPVCPKFRYYQDLIEADAHYNSLVQLEEQRIFIEELKIKNEILEKQNSGLKQRLYRCQYELKRREQQAILRESQTAAQKLAQVSVQESTHSNRKQAKLKLLQQIAVIQNRCREMKEQMTTYKLRQEEQLQKVMKERQQLRMQNDWLSQKQEYNAKFIEVFMSMLQKLPIKLDADWSKKKKIAIGWKVVKHLVKKALKLGIIPPAIVERQKQELQ